MTSFGWGEVHKSYTNNDLNKEFRIIRTEEDFKKYFGNDIPYKPGIYNTKHRGDGEQCANEKMCDAGCGYTHVIRYEGVN